MSTSSSSSCEHDVFFCFHGKETREGFTGHLYHALSMHGGLNTFMDDQLPKGTDISEIFKRIEWSRIAIVIFSPNFASSTWCMDELVKIIDCKERIAGFKVLPVFYKVAPADLRGPKGKTAKHLAKLGKEHPDAEKVKRWRVALKKLSNLEGWTYKQGVESELITKIVQGVQGNKAHRITMKDGVDHKEWSFSISFTLSKKN